MRHYIAVDAAEITEPRLVDSHGFYVYEVDVSARLITVGHDGLVSADVLVELDDDTEEPGITVEPLLPRSAPTSTPVPTEADRAALVARYARFLGDSSGPTGSMQTTLRLMLNEFAKQA